MKGARTLTSLVAAGALALGIGGAKAGELDWMEYNVTTFMH